MAAARGAGDAHRRAARPAAPGVAPVDRDAVAVHSEVARDPWHRYQSTVAFVSSVTYGDDEEAEIAISRVRAVHDDRAGASTRAARRTRPTIPTCSRTCTRRSSTARSRAAAVYGPRLSTHRDRDRYVAEMAQVAQRLGVDRSAARRGGGRRGRSTTADAPCNTRAGRDLAWLLVLPPLPVWLRPAYGVLFASAVDLLPRQCAVDLGLLPVWSPARPAVRASNTALLRSATFAVELASRPPRLAPRRAPQLRGRAR